MSVGDSTSWEPTRRVLCALQWVSLIPVVGAAFFYDWAYRLLHPCAANLITLPVASFGALGCCAVVYFVLFGLLVALHRVGRHWAGFRPHYLPVQFPSGWIAFGVPREPIGPMTPRLYAALALGPLVALHAVAVPVFLLFSYGRFLLWPLAGLVPSVIVSAWCVAVVVHRRPPFIFTQGLKVFFGLPPENQ